MDIIESLGIQFKSVIDPAFGKNVETAVKNFQDKIKPSIQQLTTLFKGLGVTVSAFYKMVEQTPVINIAKSFDTSGISEKLVGTFKDARTKSVAEFEKLHSEIQGQVNKLRQEFAKLEGWISDLRAGENPIIDWGKPAFSAKKGVYFPESKRAIDLATEQTAPAGVVEAERQARITEYLNQQRSVYQQMVGLIGQMGAFEQARLATSELIAQRVREETQAREKVVEFVSITKELLSRGLLAEGVDEKKLQSMKQYLDELIKTEEGRKILNQELDVIMGKIVKDEQAIKDIILSSVGDKEKILAITKQIADQYEKIKASSIGTAGGGTGGLGGGGGEWDRLIGKIQLAGVAVSQFQQKLQTIQVKALINPDEFTRLSNIAKAINSEVGDLTNRIARLGSQSVARDMAQDWDVLRADIEKTGQAIKEAEALQKKGLPVANIIDLDKAVYGLTARLRDLAKQGETVQLQALQAGLSKTNAEITKLTGGIEINRKSLKQLGLGTLELEKLQGLLNERMKMIRQEFTLTGKATAEMNAAMKSTGESLVVVQYAAGQFSRRTGDALRAIERWGAGFKDMLKSQMAWLAGGALIFGTVFKIQQAFTETIGTMFKFKQAMIDVGAITEASADEMVILEQAARKVATSTKMGFLEAADALKILGQAGLTAKQSAQALETVAMLVTATGASTQEAVKVLTTAINVWNISAKESTRVGNVLAAALNYSKLEINDLATAFNYVAATAAQVGMSIEETAASIAVLSNAGIMASTTGTGLRGILAQLIAPTKQFKDEIEAVGLKFSDLRMPGHNLIEVLRKLQKAGFDLGNIFEGLEKRQAGALASMLNMGSEAFQHMTTALTGTNAMVVMFERSMEGPLNRLTVFKNKLLDVGISATGTVIPAFNALLGLLARLFDAFKDVAPMLLFIGAMELLTVSVTNAGVALKIFGVALNFVKTHPIIAGLTLLTGAIAGVKYILDLENESRKEREKTIDREISTYMRQVGELEVLRGKLQDVKTTDQELRDSVIALSGSFEDLRKLVREGKVDWKELGETAIAHINSIYQKINELKVERMQLMLQDLKTLQDKTEETKERMTLAMTGLPKDWGEGFYKVEELEKIARKFKNTLVEQEEAVQKNTDEIVRLISAFNNLSDAEFEAILNSVKFTFEQKEQAFAIREVALALAEAEKARKKQTEQEKASSDMLKALRQLEYDLLDEYGKALKKYEDRLKVFEGSSREAIRGRALAYQEFYEEVGKIIDKQEKAIGERDKKWNELRFKREEEELRDNLELARKEPNERLRIQKSFDAEFVLEQAKFYQKLAELKHRWQTGELKEQDYKIEVEEAGRALERAFKTLEQKYSIDTDKLNGKIASLNETRIQQQIKAMEELATAQLRSAKDVDAKLSAQAQITNMEFLRANEELADAIHKILKRYEGLGPEFEQDLEQELNAVIGVFKTKVQTLEIEGQKKATDIILSDAERQMKLKIEMDTRRLREERKALQAEFDAMSDAERESDYGKYLKYQIDLVAISLDEATKKVTENTMELLQGMEQTPEVVAAISQLRQEYDKLTDSISKAKQETRRFEDSQKGLLEGMSEGWTLYWGKLEKQFEKGKQFMFDFLRTTETTLSTIFNDLLTGQLKSFKDYFRSFANSIAKTWSDMLAKMVMQWIKSLANMQSSSGGGNWFSSLLGGLGGIISGIFGGGFPSNASYPVDIGNFYHRGGEVVKKHEGGLQRDEVIAKLLSREYVLRREAAQSIGREPLDYMNRTGQIPERKESRAITLEIYNVLDPADVVARGIAENDNVVINPVVSSYNQNGPMRRTLLVDQ